MVPDVLRCEKNALVHKIQTAVRRIERNPILEQKIPEAMSRKRHRRDCQSLSAWSGQLKWNKLSYCNLPADTKYGV
jgi:hypothetical protein